MNLLVFAGIGVGIFLLTYLTLRYFPSLSAKISGYGKLKQVVMYSAVFVAGLLTGKELGDILGTGILPEIVAGVLLGISLSLLMSSDVSSYNEEGEIKKEQVSLED